MAAIWESKAAPKGPVFDTVQTVGGPVWARAVPAMDAVVGSVDIKSVLLQYGVISKSTPGSYKEWAEMLKKAPKRERDGAISALKRLKDDLTNKDKLSIVLGDAAFDSIPDGDGITDEEEAVEVPENQASLFDAADSDDEEEEEKKEEDEDKPKREESDGEEKDEDEDDTDPEGEWKNTPETDEDEKALDGDFPGHPFRGNQYRKAGRESGAAVGASIKAKRAEKRGDGKTLKAAHKVAHHAHTAAALTADTKKAKSYHKKMARFHGTQSGEAMDSLLDAANEYPLYHKQFSGAVQAAIAYAEKKGFKVDDDDWDRKVAMGPKKPDEGKTNSYSVALTKDGKEQKKALQIQVYGMGDRGYELNCYIS